MNRHHSDAELRALGFVRAPDGYLLDNRDGFYDEHPDDFIGTYDNRTHAAIRYALLQKLMVLAAGAPDQLREVA